MANKVILTGNLGKEPEFNENKTRCILSVGTHRPVKKADGEWETVTDWFRVYCFGPLVNRCQSDKVEKGRFISVVASIQNNNYEKDGRTVYQDQIIAENIDY